MATPKLSYEFCKRVVDEVQATVRDGGRPPGELGVGPGAITLTAERLAVADKTVNGGVIRRALDRAKTYGMDVNWLDWPGYKEKEGLPEVEFPKFPNDDLEADEILDHLERGFTQEYAHYLSLRWFEIKISTESPIGICWFGDPHLGGQGFHVELLRRDVEIVKNAEGMFAANIGDTADNWGGRLIRLYADTNITRARERILATWFLQEAEIPWLLWLFGNHEEMDGALKAHLNAINANLVPMINWRARFVIRFANDQRVRIDAAHDHKGHSLWNELHAQDRASLHDEHADLFIAGHRHDWALKQKELPTGRIATLARARGYKFIDSHADRFGFTHKTNGASIVTVLDPKPRSGCELVRAFADVEEGAEYLAWKRRPKK